LQTSGDGLAKYVVLPQIKTLTMDLVNRYSITVMRKIPRHFQGMNYSHYHGKASAWLNFYNRDAKYRVKS